MRIAITFLTCDRFDYTQITLRSLVQHNDLSKFILLHGDDASTDQRGNELAKDCGFTPRVMNTGRRRGVARMTADLFNAAQKAGATHILNLQNDWCTVRPLPMEDIDRIFADPKVYCMRLYGAMKSATGRCGIHHGGRDPRKVVDWRPYLLPGYQIGDIHWGHPPAITITKFGLALTQGADREGESCRRSGRIMDYFTVRPVENIVNHIGRERTPEFKG